jgi:hypothetical protein
MLRAAAFLTAVLLVLGAGIAARGCAQKLKVADDVEAQSKVEPPIRTVLIGEGRLLECQVFPMRSYDEVLLHCTLCQEQNFDPLKHPPLLFDCTR